MMRNFLVIAVLLACLLAVALSAKSKVDKCKSKCGGNYKACKQKGTPVPKCKSRQNKCKFECARKFPSESVLNCYKGCRANTDRCNKKCENRVNKGACVNTCKQRKNECRFMCADKLAKRALPEETEEARAVEAQAEAIKRRSLETGPDQTGPVYADQQ